MLSDKKILNETNNHNSPLKVKWSVLYRSKHLVNLNPNTDVLSTSVPFRRDGPFHFQGGEGWLWFFFLKKYSDFGGGIKK